MKRIVIIGANEFQNPLILKAKEMGYETHVFAWQAGDIGEQTADVFYPISIIEKDKILEKCREINPDGICTIASDLANITVNYVAEKLNLACNSEHCIRISTNKYLMRKAFKEKGVPTPLFYIVNNQIEELEQMHYPIIVKPTDRSGSRAITKLETPEGLDIAIKQAVEQSFEKQAIAEEYIEGNEYSFESVSYNGEHYGLAVTKKFTTGAPHFIETGHIQPSGIEKNKLSEVKEVIFKALDALEIKNGASHAEFKITPEGDIRIIEIGSRMGGDCIGSDLVQLSTGYDFLKMIIDISCGKKPDLTCGEKYSSAEIRFIFNQQDYDKLLEIKKSYPEKIYRESKIDKNLFGKADNSGNRAGFYILIGEKI